jgi:threonine dehydrogenase-like Zn-dependent dehydrogenase
VKAAQIVAPRQIEMIDIDKPDISSDPEGSVLIKTQMNAICGTDMPWFAMERPASDYPLSLGTTIHECIGVVAASKSDRFKEGDAVLALPGRIGGLAEYFVSHEAVTIPLVEFERKDCILMSQPLGTVIWACSKLGNLLNQDVVVMGQGPMGLLFTHLVSNLGAKTVVATDLVDFRLEAAKQMQATHTINAAEVDTVAAVEEITDGRMADLVFEVIGHQTETINQCLDLVKRDGTILAFGVPDDPTYPFRFGELFRKNIRLIGSVGPDAQNNFPLAMDMIAQGRIDVSPMITHRLPFTEVQRGFELSLHKKDEAIKIVLEYD